MIKLGNFLFRYRNGLFPLFYALLFVPSPAIFSSYTIAIVLGLVIAMTGQIIRAVNAGEILIARSGRNRKIYADGLVTDGIFKHCRNPLYIGNILLLLGLGIVANSLIFVLLMVPLFAFFYQAIVKAEEHYLSGQFGDAYHRYCQDVNRWIPDFSGLGTTLSHMNFSWRKFLVREYNQSFIWMAAAILVIAKNLYFRPYEISFEAALPYLIIAFVLLVIAYGVIRFLKKTRRMVY